MDSPYFRVQDQPEGQNAAMLHGDTFLVEYNTLCSFRSRCIALQVLTFWFLFLVLVQLKIEHIIICPWFLILSPCLIIGMVWLVRIFVHKITINGRVPEQRSLDEVMGSIIWDQPGLKHVLYGTTIILTVFLFSARVDGIFPSLPAVAIGGPVCFAVSAEALLLSMRSRAHFFPQGSFCLIGGLLLLTFTLRMDSIVAWDWDILMVVPFLFFGFMAFLFMSTAFLLTLWVLASIWVQSRDVWLMFMTLVGTLGVGTFSVTAFVSVIRFTNFLKGIPMFDGGSGAEEIMRPLLIGNGCLLLSLVSPHVPFNFSMTCPVFVRDSKIVPCFRWHMHTFPPIHFRP